MPALVIHLIEPPAAVSGYLRRYLVEISAHLFCGSVPTRVSAGLIDAVRRASCRGTVITLDSTAPLGIRWIYRSGTTPLVALDGVEFVHRPAVSPHTQRAKSSHRQSLAP